MSETVDYLEVLDDLAGEQHALHVGAGLVLIERDTVCVSGDDRLSWLTTLSSQVITDIGEGSRELLLLDANGHIQHAAGVCDDGTTTWLLTDQGRGPALAAFLESMRFMLRVEVCDVTDRYCQVAMNSSGPVIEAATMLPQPPQVIWRDPWPGVTVGGTTYATVSQHPGENFRGAVAVIERHQAATIVAKILSLAETCAEYPLTTDDGYPVTKPRQVGAGAWEAERIASWRPRLNREVDEKSLPHELDWLRSAVHLEKGCYCGQETVARIVNLGRPPRRLVACTFDGSQSLLPPPGAAIMVGQRQVGVVTSSARDAWEGPVGLALVKRAVRADTVTVTWQENDTDYQVAATICPIVGIEGKASASPKTRPGAGIERLPGAGGMRVGSAG